MGRCDWDDVEVPAPKCGWKGVDTGGGIGWHIPPIDHNDDDGNFPPPVDGGGNNELPGAAWYCIEGIEATDGAGGKPTCEYGNTFERKVREGPYLSKEECEADCGEYTRWFCYNKGTPSARCVEKTYQSNEFVPTPDGLFIFANEPTCLEVCRYDPGGGAAGASTGEVCGWVCVRKGEENPCDRACESIVDLKKDPLHGPGKVLDWGWQKSRNGTWYLDDAGEDNVRRSKGWHKTKKGCELVCVEPEDNTVPNAPVTGNNYSRDAFSVWQCTDSETCAETVYSEADIKANPATAPGSEGGKHYWVDHPLGSGENWELDRDAFAGSLQPPGEAGRIGLLSAKNACVENAWQNCPDPIDTPGTSTTPGSDRDVEWYECVTMNEPCARKTKSWFDLVEEFPIEAYPGLYTERGIFKPNEYIDLIGGFKSQNDCNEICRDLDKAKGVGTPGGSSKIWTCNREIWACEDKDWTKEEAEQIAPYGKYPLLYQKDRNGNHIINMKDFATSFLGGSLSKSDCEEDCKKPPDGSTGPHAPFTPGGTGELTYWLCKSVKPCVKETKSIADIIADHPIDSEFYWMYDALGRFIPGRYLDHINGFASENTCNEECPDGEKTGVPGGVATPDSIYNEPIDDEIVDAGDGTFAGGGITKWKCTEGNCIEIDQSDDGYDSAYAEEATCLRNCTVIRVNIDPGATGTPIGVTRWKCTNSGCIEIGQDDDAFLSNSFPSEGTCQTYCAPVNNIIEGPPIDYVEDWTYIGDGYADASEGYSNFPAPTRWKCTPGGCESVESSEEGYTDAFTTKDSCQLNCPTAGGGNIDIIRYHPGQEWIPKPGGGHGADKTKIFDGGVFECNPECVYTPPVAMHWICDSSIGDCRPWVVPPKGSHTYETYHECARNCFKLLDDKYDDISVDDRPLSYWRWVCVRNIDGTAKCELQWVPNPNIGHILRSECEFRCAGWNQSSDDINQEVVSPSWGWTCNIETGNCEYILGGNYATEQECSIMGCGRFINSNMDAIGSPSIPPSYGWKCNTAAGVCEYVIGGSYDSKDDCNANCGSDISVDLILPDHANEGFWRWICNSDSKTCNLERVSNPNLGDINYDECYTRCGDGSNSDDSIIINIDSLNGIRDRSASFTERTTENSTVGDNEFLYEEFLNFLNNNTNEKRLVGLDYNFCESLSSFFTGYPYHYAIVEKSKFVTLLKNSVSSTNKYFIYIQPAILAREFKKFIFNMNNTDRIGLNIKYLHRFWKKFEHKSDSITIAEPTHTLDSQGNIITTATEDILFPTIPEDKESFDEPPLMNLGDLNEVIEVEKSTSSDILLQASKEKLEKAVNRLASRWRTGLNTISKSKPLKDQSFLPSKINNISQILEGGGSEDVVLLRKIFGNINHSRISINQDIIFKVPDIFGLCNYTFTEFKIDFRTDLLLHSTSSPNISGDISFQSKNGKISTYVKGSKREDIGLESLDSIVMSVIRKLRRKG